MNRNLEQKMIKTKKIQELIFWKLIWHMISNLCKHQSSCNIKEWSCLYLDLNDENLKHVFWDNKLRMKFMFNYKFEEKYNNTTPCVIYWHFQNG
jgi:hypothetical protein